MIIFSPSALANKYLEGKKGIEIGGSYHNKFDLDTLNVDYTDEITVFKKMEMETCGQYMKVDVVAEGDNLPFSDNSWDFVINSHVLEHFFDPIKTINEWLRVIKPGGYLFMIIPHKERTFDRDRPRTMLQELIYRHHGLMKKPEIKDDNTISEENLRDLHYSIWITEDVLELCKYMNLNVVEYQDVDDKVGNGFTIVIKKS